MTPIKSCSGIYALINSANGHLYIGSSSNVARRVSAHFCASPGKGSASIAHAIAKYGRDSIFPVLIEECPRELLPVREAAWIERLSPEYNRTRLTSSGGRIVSSEQRAKISRQLSGRTLPEAHRSAIAAGISGRPVSPETRRKISLALTGRKFSEASLEKMRVASRNMTPERKAKMSRSARNRKASPEANAKRSAALKGKPWSPARWHAERNRT